MATAALAVDGRRVLAGSGGVAAGNRRRAGRGARRLFFALWPDPPCREQLGRIGAVWQATAGGRQVALDNLHVTLLFLGKVQPAVLPRLVAAADRLRCPREVLQFGRPEYWARPALLCLVAPTPPGLAGLVDGLRGVAAGCALPRPRETFVPHVTLVRRVNRLTDCGVVEQLLPVAWPVNGFRLLESVQGASAPRYRTLAQWPAA